MQTTLPEDSGSTRRVLVAATAIAATSRTAAAQDVAAFITAVRSHDDAVRGPAWQGAAIHGAAAVQPLAAAMTDEDFEVARAAKRALWVIVRHAGRPGAPRESRAVAGELIPLLSSATAPVRREILWMLSEIGGDEAIAPVARLLADAEVRGDALAALQRLPGRKATAEMRRAMAAAPEDFKYALGHALRTRGEKVPGYPGQQLVPSRQTEVAP